MVKKIRTPITSTKITSGLAVYNGGPLWNTGYKWYNIYWGSYWNSPNIPFGPKEIDTATQHITTDKAYWGGLSEYATNGYDLGYGVFAGSIIISTNPPSTIDDTQIGPQIKQWITSGLIPELGQKGAYNIFFPPNVTIILEGSASCQTFCDYHNTDGTHYYTVEPYPCTSGCNQCTNNPFDALTMGLSEELVELATDMSPGTGWVIGNIELCDECDQHFVCNQISTGEYVNAWYSNKYNTCWTPNWPPSSPSPPPPSTCPIAKVFTTTYNTFAKLLHRKTRLYAYVPEQCSC
jgi:hypothetical protein